MRTLVVCATHALSHDELMPCPECKADQLRKELAEAQQQAIRQREKAAEEERRKEYALGTQIRDAIEQMVIDNGIGVPLRLGALVEFDWSHPCRDCQMLLDTKQITSPLHFHECHDDDVYVASCAIPREEGRGLQVELDDKEVMVRITDWEDRYYYFDVPRCILVHSHESEPHDCDCGYCENGYCECCGDVYNHNDIGSYLHHIRPSGELEDDRYYLCSMCPEVQLDRGPDSAIAHFKLHLDEYFVEDIANFIE